MLSPQLILQFTEVVQWLYFRGGPTFSKGGGGPTFSRGGVQMLISLETHITCDFPVGSLSPPWDPRMHNNLSLSCSSLLKRHKKLLARKSQYHVNCRLAYDTHLKMPRLNRSEFKKIIIKFQDLDCELCLRVFLVLGTILAQHRVCFSNGIRNNL